MPSNGQHSFLPIVSLKPGDTVLMCQCPQTGNTHFYRAPAKKRLKDIDVSTPSNGQHSFLRPNSILGGRCLYGMCQRPQTGNTHFYPEENKESVYSRMMCQRPQTGNTHFYSLSRKVKRNQKQVSTPSNGQHSFLLNNN